MKRISAPIALQRFIGGMGGVNSISVGEGCVIIEYDKTEIGGGMLYKLAVENVEKLGYKILG